MFYDRFYKLCQAAGVTPSKVAEALSLNKSTVYMWKKQGTTPNADTVQKIARYFGATADYLLERDNFPFPDLSGQTMSFTATTPEEKANLSALFGRFEHLTNEDKELLISMAKQLNNARKDGE